MVQNRNLCHGSYVAITLPNSKFGGGIQKVADDFKDYQRERIGYCVTSGSGVRIVRECSIA